MSQVKLSDEISIDAAQIESAKLIKSGQKTGGTATISSSPEPDAVTAPEDELIVHLHGGTHFAIRGEKEAKLAWDTLSRARESEQLNFEMAQAASQ